MSGAVGGEDDEAGSASSAFRPDTILAEGRYRVLRVIAAGGMGEVYEAEDRELGSRVALKTVRPELALSAPTLQRFRREIQLARQVTHPNVCRIYELGRHRGERHDLVFLTMQLLDGETLKDRLQRDGPLTTAEALPLVEDMAAALDAAHEAGVVHRDFKSANVQLVPDARRPGGLRAVVTDFGLARDLEQEEGSGATLTEFGALVGTPGYMSPEQVQGHPATPASDLYAFGLVIYEMVTGELPFTGRNALQTAIRRLEGDAPSPADVVPGLDRRWEDAILACLDRTPDDRPKSAAEVLRRLESDPLPLAARQKARRGWKSAVVPALVVLAIAALLLVFGRSGKDPGPKVSSDSASAAEEAVRLRPAVAVVGFKNLTGDPESDWVSTALREMISTEIADENELRLLSGEEIQQMKAELGVEAEQSFSSATLEKIRRRLGVDLLVLGSYLRHGEQIRLDLAVQDAVSSEVRHRVSGRSEADDLIGLVEEVGRRLRDELGLDAARGAELAQAFPVTAEGSRLYSLGLERLRRFEPLEARVLLEAAVEEAPESPLAHAALAQAWAALGDQARARSVAKRAHELSGALGRRERLWIEGLYLELTDRLDAAAELYAELREENPDDLEAGIRLLHVHEVRAAYAEGLQVVEELRSLPSPLDTDPRILLYSAAFLTVKSSERCIAEAGKAIREAEERGAINIAGRAYERKAWCLVNDGRYAEAVRTFEEAITSYRRSGYRRGLVSALGARAVATARAGSYRRALEEFPQAIDEARNLGDPTLTRTLQSNLGYLLLDLGRVAEAGAMWRTMDEAEPTARFGITFSNQQASLALAEGNLAAASEHLESMRRELRDSGFDRAASWQTHMQGRLERLQGRVGRARKLQERTLAETQAGGYGMLETQSRLELGLLAYDAGDLEGARSALETALELTTDSGNFLARSRLEAGLAAVELAQSRPGDALSRADMARRKAASLGALHLEVLAYALEAEAAAMAGDAERARRALARARELLPRVEHVPMRLRAGFHCDRARIRLGEEPLEGIRAEVETRLARAEELGLAPLVAEGRATLELMKAEGD